MNSRLPFPVLSALLGLLFLTQVASARMRGYEVEKTPVNRLIMNLKSQAEARPEDLGVQLNLARTHAMAYALKTDTLPVQVGYEWRGAWLGWFPAAVPFKAEPTTDPMKLQAANEHLQLAIRFYEQILKIDPNHLTAKLGHAWCLEQGGKKVRAIDEYRKTIELGWKKEKELTRADLGWKSIVKEATGYLIPLLDKEADAAEIKRLTEQVHHVDKIIRPFSPIAIPLRDGLTVNDIHDRDASVEFDLDGSGYKKSWSWINTQAAWLVYDHNSTGQITSGLQLFGNVTFWLLWDNGYEALSALDDNADGSLSGRELHQLALWHDKNGNGISEPGEVQSLDESGITRLSCRYERRGTGVDEIVYSPLGVSFADGTQRPTYDLILQPMTSE